MLVDFQKKYGLVADGIIGKKTATKIKEVFGLTDIQTAYFLGQGSVETSDFKLKRENGRYSETQLKKYFSYYKNRPEETQKDALQSVYDNMEMIRRMQDVMNKDNYISQTTTY